MPPEYDATSTASHSPSASSSSPKSAHLPKDTEIELKLAGDLQTLEWLSRSPLVRGRADGGPKTTEMESVYYDTRKHRLCRDGIAFRVRRRDGRYIQTVKASGGEVSGVTRRGEWETELPTAQPDPTAVTAPEATALLGPLHAEDLRPFFSTKIDRETMMLDDGSVEIAFDRGVISADGGTLPVSEIELELRKGTPAQLFRLALALHKVAPLRLECRSKAARGYGLATGKTARSSKGKRPTLADTDTVETAMAAILRYGLMHWTLNEAAVLDGVDREGVHQMRVGLRRLRSALSLFRAVMPPRDLAWLRDETRWLAQQLGPARDLDVFQEELLEPIVALRPDDPGLVALAQAIEADRLAAYDLARQALSSPRYTTLILRFGAWIEERGWRPRNKRKKPLDRPITPFAAAALQKRQKQALKAGRGFAKLSPEERHVVRIALKKLRYAAEFFRSLYPAERTTPYLKRLASLQDMMGQMNDVAIIHQLLGDLLDRHASYGEQTQLLARASGLVVVWHNRHAAGRDADLQRVWDEFLAAEPFWVAPTG